MNICRGGKNDGKNNENEKMENGEWKMFQTTNFCWEIILLLRTYFGTQKKKWIVENEATQNGIYVSPQNENTQNIICNLQWWFTLRPYKLFCCNRSLLSSKFILCWKKFLIFFKSFCVGILYFIRRIYIVICYHSSFNCTN